MENHTGTHKESTDLMRKRRASLGKRRTETQMRYDFYSPRLWCLGSHVTLRGRPRSFFPLRSSAPARQIYRRGQTEHPKGLPCEARENAPGSSVSQSKISETKLIKESLLISQAIAAPILPIYFIGGKCPGLLIHTQSSFGQIFSSNNLTCLLGSIIHHFSLEKVNNLTCITKAPRRRGFSGYRKFLEMLMRNEVACRPIDRRRKRGRFYGFNGSGAAHFVILSGEKCRMLRNSKRFLALLEMTIRESPSPSSLVPAFKLFGLSFSLIVIPSAAEGSFLHYGQYHIGTGRETASWCHVFLRSHMHRLSVCKEDFSLRSK